MKTISDRLKYAADRAPNYSGLMREAAKHTDWIEQQLAEEPKRHASLLRSLAHEMFYHRDRDSLLAQANEPEALDSTGDAGFMATVPHDRRVLRHGAAPDFWRKAWEK